MQEFFKWLAGLPGWLSVLVFMSLLGSVSALIVFGLRSIESFSIGGGRGEERKLISIKQKTTHPVNHIGCPHVGSVMRLQTDYAKFFAWKHEVLFIRVLEDQMNEAESYLTSIGDTIRRNFVTVLHDKPVSDEDVFDSVKYRRFVDTLSLCDTRIRSFLRRCFKENHLAVKTDLEFATYKEDRINHTVELAVKFFEEHYARDEFGSASFTLQGVLKTYEADIRDYVGIAFDRARYISRHYRTLIDEAEEKLDTEYLATYGVKPTAKYE